MSRFTLEQLHNWHRVGFGVVPWWHKSAIADSLGFPVLFPGAVPISVARELLGSISVVDAEVWNVFTDANGDRQTVKDENRIAKLDANTGHAFGYFRPTATHTNYTVELLDNLSAIVGGNDNVGIESVGILNYGATAHLTIGMPESIRDEKSGVEFRPRILASSALDGTLALSFRNVVQLSVCDNTLDAALGESFSGIKVKRTKNARMRIADARAALGILTDSAESFGSALSTLTETKVSEEAFTKYLDSLTATPADASKHAVTQMENKRDALLTLYRNDARVSPWAGTAFGVLQMMNTYSQHVAIRRGAGDDGDTSALRAFRNTEDVISGKSADRDAQTLDSLFKVLATV